MIHPVESTNVRDFQTVRIKVPGEPTCGRLSLQLLVVVVSSSSSSSIGWRWPTASPSQTFSDKCTRNCHYRSLQSAR